MPITQVIPISSCYYCNQNQWKKGGESVGQYYCQGCKSWMAHICLSKHEQSEMKEAIDEPNTPTPQ